VSLRRCLAVASLLSCLPLVAFAAEQPIAAPIFLASQILALRGAPPNESQLHIIFDCDKDGIPEAPISLSIGPDYFAIVGDDSETLYDLKLERRFVIDRRQSTLVNFSLYGDVIFRQIELTRRIELARAVAQTQPDQFVPTSLEPFWIEGELGIAQPGPIQGHIEHQEQDGTVRFRFVGQEVASFLPNMAAIPEELRHSYGAFVHHRLSLHPAIAKFVAESGHLPARLVFLTQESGSEARETLTLRSAEIVAGPYPMSANLTRVILPGGGRDADVVLAQDLMPDMVEAVAGRAKNGPRSVVDYRRIIDGALREHRLFQASLLLAELALQWGRGAAECEDRFNTAPCHPRREIEHTLSADPRAVQMFQAAAIETKEPDRSLALWRALDRSDVSDGYVADIFIARLASVRGRRDEAASAFKAAFSGNPYIPELYRDLGDHFARASRIDLAWLCYDIGRSLPSRSGPDALQDIDALERQLVQQYPGFF
jgi:hypothetical protein